MKLIPLTRKATLIFGSRGQGAVSTPCSWHTLKILSINRITSNFEFAVFVGEGALEIDANRVQKMGDVFLQVLLH